ncbi:MAG TPA: hypothetical protein VMU51_05120 [Mycobacteriales bacterium]|nr:hypothetical protein [Mycobacteriales bacterium]
MDIPPAGTPIVCDMTSAPDTPAERMAEYQRLFAAGLVGRERTGQGVRFRFRAEPGLAAWVRDLAAREKACCGFFAFEVTRSGGEVWWDTAVVDDESARLILAEFYSLPDTVADGIDAWEDRLAARGLRFSPGPVRGLERQPGPAAAVTTPSAPRQV